MKMTCAGSGCAGMGRAGVRMRHATLSDRLACTQGEPAVRYSTRAHLQPQTCSPSRLPAITATIPLAESRANSHEWTPTNTDCPDHHRSQQGWASNHPYHPQGWTRGRSLAGQGTRPGAPPTRGARVPPSPPLHRGRARRAAEATTADPAAGRRRRARAAAGWRRRARAAGGR